QDVVAALGVGAPILRERLEHLGVVGQAAGGDANVQLEVLFDGRLDFGAELGLVRFGGAENDVAAVDEGLHVDEACVFESDLELGHRDDGVAADVDAAQQGHVGGEFFLGGGHGSYDAQTKTPRQAGQVQH